MSDDLKSILETFTVSSKEGAMKVFEEDLLEFETLLGSPAPSDPLNGMVYVRWERKVMMYLGRVDGSLALLRLLGVFTPEQSKRLMLRATSALTRAMVQVQMQGRVG